MTTTRTRAVSTARTGERPQREAQPAERHLRVVRVGVRRGLVGSLFLIVLFATLFAVAAMQSALVPGQMHLDELNSRISTLADGRDHLRDSVDHRAAPERLAAVAATAGLAHAQDVVSLPTPSTVRSR